MTIKVSLFIPVLNEIEGLRLVFPQIDLSLCHEVIFVDGGSIDGSREYIESIGYKLYDQDRPKLSGAYKKCLDVATGDIIVAFSPDNNSIPSLIGPLVEKIKEGNDIVIASRYLGGAKSYDDDLVTAFGNWMFTKMTNLLFGTSYTDVLVMYRAFNKNIISNLALDLDNPGWEIKMLIRGAKANLRVAEIPGDEPKRVGGIRKMNPLVNGTEVLKAIFGEILRK